MLLVLLLLSFRKGPKYSPSPKQQLPCAACDLMTGCRSLVATETERLSPGTALYCLLVVCMSVKVQHMCPSVTCSSPSSPYSFRPSSVWPQLKKESRCVSFSHRIACSPHPATRDPPAVVFPSAGPFFHTLTLTAVQISIAQASCVHAFVDRSSERHRDRIQRAADENR